MVKYIKENAVLPLYNSLLHLSESYLLTNFSLGYPIEKFELNNFLSWYYKTTVILDIFEGFVKKGAIKLILDDIS